MAAKKKTKHELEEQISKDASDKLVNEKIIRLDAVAITLFDKIDKQADKIDTIVASIAKDSKQTAVAIQELVGAVAKHEDNIRELRAGIRYLGHTIIGGIGATLITLIILSILRAYGINV